MGPDREARARYEREREAYWRQRDELLKRYRGRWVAIVAGRVAAVADQMNKAAEAAMRSTGSTSMYVALVGSEDAVMRVRAVSAGRYDASYVPAIPVADLDVSDVSDARQTSAEFVVDTGADLTLLRSAVADEVAIWNNIAGQVHVAGVGDAGEARFVYMALVHVAGQPLLVAADCREDIEENILGRDVLNELDLRLSAKRNVVELEWIEPSPE